jgi:hypothetical protein
MHIRRALVVQESVQVPHNHIVVVLNDEEPVHLVNMLIEVHPDEPACVRALTSNSIRLPCGLPLGLLILALQLDNECMQVFAKLGGCEEKMVAPVLLTRRKKYNVQPQLPTSWKCHCLGSQCW